MMRQIAFVAGVAIIAALALQTWRVGQLRDRNEALQATVEGYREAARIHAKYVQSRETLVRDAVDVDRELTETEGLNEPLSDALRGAAGRVWSNP